MEEIFATDETHSPPPILKPIPIAMKASEHIFPTTVANKRCHYVFLFQFFSSASDSWRR